MHISSKKQFFGFLNVNQRIRRWSIILFLDTYPKQNEKIYYKAIILQPHFLKI